MRGEVVALAALLVSGAAAAQTLSTNSQLFHDVCIVHAPALSEATIMTAARSQVPANGSDFAQASVAVDEGRRCVLAVSGGSTSPSDAEVQLLASAFARQVGARSIQQVRSAIGGDVWYRVDLGGTSYGIEAIPDGGNVRYSISRR